jgi:DNA-binding MltR family transcriptional regulator
MCSVCCRFLDSALRALLTVALVQDAKVGNDLFNGTAPLSTFSSRIKLTFYLGKISKECRSDLDVIRGIRNEFAHHATKVSFDDQSIADRCRNLQFSHRERAQRPRAHFTSAVSGVLTVVITSALRATSPTAQSNDWPKDQITAIVRKQEAAFDTLLKKGQPESRNEG